MALTVLVVRRSGLESDYGRCDCLVNNAGFAFKGVAYPPLSPVLFSLATVS